MRRLLMWVTAIALSTGLGTAQAQISLKGSDTLELVTKDAIAVCGLGTRITYLGGGSGTGQAAMVSGTQQIAPMSRELNGTACTATAGQLLTGLDGISIIASNQVFGDSVDQTPDTEDNCSDSINGGQALPVTGCTAADGCTTPGTYVFTDWKDVLAMIYGGQNHVTTQGQLLGHCSTTTATICSQDTDCPTGQTCAARAARNPARINCASAVRQALLNNWGLIFNDSLLDPQPCRATGCVMLKHAFRRGDLSGTTDTFVTLAGLVAIPPFTTTVAGIPTLAVPDAFATANPFCNAGPGVMNKGDSDYLDLDPVRRIVDSDVAANGRLGFEQVAEGYLAPSNPPPATADGTPLDARVQPAVTVLHDYSNASEPNVLPEPTNPNAQALQKSELALRQGLGVVLPIEVPGNFTTEQIAYHAPPSTQIFNLEPVLCTPGKYAPTFADSGHPLAMCPNGRNQPCLLPVNTDTTTVNFNCLSNGPVPASPPVRDGRVFNLLVVDGQFGHYVRDNYVNPNLTIPTSRQNRVVSAFYRLHETQVTQLGAPVFGINCKKFSSTEQIGCLVVANPCSIGFAGREAVDNLLNMAVQINGIKPTVQNIANLATLGTPVYPLARRLWLNALNGFGTVTGDQLSLLRCFQGQVPGVQLSDIDNIMVHRNFVAVPAGVTRTKSCPAVFP